MVLIRSLLATVKIIKCRGKVGGESSEWLVLRGIEDDRVMQSCATLVYILRNHKHGKRKTISEAKKRLPEKE